MAQYSPNRVGFALVLLLVLNFSHALDKCKTGCDGASGALKLTPGTTYKYDYDGKINILLSSAEGQQSSTEVKATVLLTQQADCSQVLRLQNVQVIGPDGKKRSGIPDVEKPVVLNSNNGALNEFMCSEQGDNQNSLNLKRAIASFFQVNSEKNTEIDVFGQCPTHITKTEDGDITTITKNKNLNKCAFRESITHNYITSTFDIHSEIQSSPVLNSNLDSKQKVKAGVLDSASIVENYLFVPFSVGRNGAKATVESKLTLTGTSKDNPAVKCDLPKSIIFENPHPVNTLKSNVNNILKLVKEIAENLGSNVVDKTALHFIDLVKVLRISKKIDILSVYNQVRSGVGFTDKEGAKKIFLDAILTAGNGDTIEVAIELLKNKELGHFEEKQLYIGLSRARHATESSIKTATDLLNRPNLPREAYLGIGSLAGRYCAAHNCEKVEVVNKIIQKFLSKLGDLKAANRKEETDMIYVLKGLTNIDYLNDAVLAKLISLAEDKKQPTRLRVATLEAFQAAPCKQKLRDSALKTLKDIQQDSEIRIKAYLVLAICPNDKIGTAVKAMLEHEKSIQVGGFISTHIKNIRTSANPDKALAKAHLGFIRTPNRFAIDIRKYSFNAELSHSIDAIGLAGDVEGNVIYSQNSWLPRSTNLNLTAEVFGQRFNFLEIAARQENLDKVIEHYLGPQGVLRKATLQQNWDHIVKPVENVFKSLKEKVDKSLRARRDVSKAQIDAINKKVQVKANELDKNLDVDLSIKNFGSEILFMNSFESTDKISPQSIIDSLVAKLNEGLDKLKNFEKVFRSNLLFLDAELSYPTSLGFPLRLGLDGASNIQVKTEGSIDVRQILSHEVDKDLNLKLSLIPSATITVVGRLSLDTPLVESGLKVASTLHTSSGGDLLVKSFKEGLGLDVKFNFPVQKQEVIGLKHDIIFQTKENGVVVNNQRLKFSQNKDFSICIDHLTNFIGLEFCADINGPNLSGKKVPVLPFPFSGDAKANIRIERGEIDTFHYRREFFSAKEGKVGVVATLEASGATKKGVGLNFEGFISPDKYIKATLNSPIKNAEAEAHLILNDKEKVLALSLKDEAKLYSAKAGLIVDEGKDKTIYKPILEYSTPDSKGPQTPPVHLEGKVIAEKHGNDVKYIFDNVQLIIPGQKTIGINGNIGTDGPAIFSDLTAGDGSLSGSLKGRLQAQPDLKIQGEFKNTMNPNLNFNIKGEFKKHNEPMHIFSNLQITHGADLNSKTNVISLVNILTMKNIKALEFSTKNKFSYPLMKINIKFDLDKSPKSLNYDAFLHYSEVKLGSELKLKYNTKTVGDYQLEFDLSSLKNKVELKSSRQINGPDDSKIANSLSVNGKKLDISGHIKHHLKPNDVNIGTDLVIKTPTSKAPWKLNQGIKLNPREIDLHVKLLSGSTPLIDILFKGNRAGNANGHIKVNFKETLHINGQIKAQKGVGSGDILIEAKSLKKTAKAETSFTMHSPTYNLDVTLYPVFNEDKNKKVVLSTKNKFTGPTLDSSNSLDLFGSILALNIKAKIASPRNGKTVVDVDLTLPGQQYLAGSFARDVSSKDGIWNFDTQVSLEQRENKATPGRKILVKVNGKNCNFHDVTGDVTIHASGDDSAGHDVKIDADLHWHNTGNKYNIDQNLKITGSILKNPIEVTYVEVYETLTGTIKMNTVVGPKASVLLDLKYDFLGKNNPYMADIAADITLPIEILSNVKVGNSFSVKISPEVQSSHLGLSGFLQTVSSSPNLNIDTKNHIKIDAERNSASATVHGELNKPIKTALDASGSFHVDPSKKTGSIKGDLKAILPQNGVIQASGVVTRIAPKEYKLDATLDLPTQSFKSNKLSVHTKRTDDNQITSQADFISDGKKYSLVSDLKLAKAGSKVDFKLTHPDGKITQLTANVIRPSDARLLANIKAMCQSSDFLLEGSLDINSENLNNFYIQVTANSPKLNIKDIFVKIGNNGSNDGKTLNIKVTSAGQNIISGSATITSRDEQGKFIVEGSGKFKVKNEDKSGNFKYIRTTLTSDKNGESGEEVSFDATLGNKAIDAELKLTNKEFRYLNSYCEESKQCAHIEIDAKTSADDISRFDNQIEITIDLRVLGIPNEFGLKAVTHRENWHLDHTVDVHFENSANKYQYSLYVHPKDIGISLTTPSRIIALEGNIVLPPPDIKTGGKLSGEIAFYTDKKNNPNSKSALSGFAVADVEKHSVNGELKLDIVGLAKPLFIKYTSTAPTASSKKTTDELIIDIFAKPDQKIIISRVISGEFSKDTYKVQGDVAASLKSIGLGIDINLKQTLSLDPKALTGNFERTIVAKLGKDKYESSVKLSASPKDGYLLIKHLNNILLEAKSDISLQKGLININTHTSILGDKPLDTNVEIKNYNTLKLVQTIQNNPVTKVLINAALIPGQIADARADYLVNDAKKELFHASIKLDEKNFLQPDAGVNSDNIKEFSTKVKDIVINNVKRGADKFKENYKKLSDDAKDITQTVKETIPDVSKTKQIYESELSKFKDELASDKTLQNLGELLKSVVGAVATVVSKVISTFSEIIEKILPSIQSAIAAIQDTIQNKILPLLNDIAKKIISVAECVLDKVSDIVFTIVAKAGELLESIHPQLKAIASTLSEITDEIGRFIHKTIQSIKDAIIEQWKHIKDEIKASPLIGELKAQYEDFLKNGLPSQEVILNTIKAISGALKEAIFIPEFQNVIDLIERYIEKKLTNKPVDDVAELQNIGSTFVDAVRKFTTALSQEAVPDILRNLRIPALNLDLIKRLPTTFGAVRISALDYLLKEDISPIIKSVVRLILVPKDMFIPIELVGAIRDEIIMTFDQKIYNFPGSCSYLAVRDAVNGNFSVIVTYENKKFAAITLSDKSGSVTVKKDKVLLNHAEVDFPVNKGGLHARREFALTTIESSAGVTIICNAAMEGCGVEVSGYYHGQLRGLLGNGNHEEFDDLTLPNGKIVSSVSELAPAYAVGSECAPVAAVELDGPSKPDPNCDKMFNWDSSLKLCYPFVDNHKLKRACENDAATGKTEAYQIFGELYSYLCWKSHIPVGLPQQPKECKNSVTPRKFNEHFDVKLPGKAADVVFVVNTNKHNENQYKEYVQPLVGQIVNEYKAKGITDINFAVLAYGGENQKPAYVTVDGKLRFHGNAPNIKFAEDPKPQKLVTNCQELDRIISVIHTIIHEVKQALGLILSGEAYLESMMYPFRADAVKSLVYVSRDYCDVGNALPAQMIKGLFLHRRDINYNAITPVRELKVKDAKTTKDVIGFNNENVITLSESKTKPTGTPALHKDISTSDLCTMAGMSFGANTFVSDNLEANKNSKQQIVQVIAKNIVSQSLKKEIELDCTCGYSLLYPLLPRNHCSAVNVKEK